MYAYKVIRRNSSRHAVSALPPSKGESTEHSYARGKKTVRRDGCGPMATFKGIKDSIEFAREMNGGWNRRFEVWRCRIQSSKDNRLWKFMDYYRYDPSHAYPGTIFADSVTLLKKVYDTKTSRCVYD